MTPEALAGKVAFGYAKAGSKLGPAHTLFRPSAATVAALAPQNRLRTLPFISSATPDVAFTRPSKYGSPIRYGLFDTTVTRVGDYVTGPTGTYFVASQNPLEAPMVVQCNAVVIITRAAAAATGLYSGRTEPTDQTILAGWNASVIVAERTQAGRADLPGDVPMKGAAILFPALPGVLIRPADHVMDELGRRYTISSAEHTDLGWRCTSTLSEA